MLSVPCHAHFTVAPRGRRVAEADAMANLQIDHRQARRGDEREGWLVPYLDRQTHLLQFVSESFICSVTCESRAGVVTRRAGFQAIVGQRIRNVGGSATPV